MIIKKLDKCECGAPAKIYFSTEEVYGEFCSWACLLENLSVLPISIGGDNRYLINVPRDTILRWATLEAKFRGKGEVTTRGIFDVQNGYLYIRRYPGDSPTACLPLDLIQEVAFDDDELIITAG